jgi:hypothetical protein
MARVVVDLAFKDYLAERATNATMVKTAIKRSVAHAFLAEPTISREASEFGQATHAVFEGNYDQVYRGGETRRSKEYKEGAQKALNFGGVCLPDKQFDLALAAGHAARSHPSLAHHLDDRHGHFETSIFVFDPETQENLKLRPDWHNPKTGMVVDLKTTQSAKPEDFERQFWKLGYDLQAAFYRYGMRLAEIPVQDEFHFLAVEKTSPHATQHFVVEKDVLDAAEERVVAALHEIAEARDHGEFETNWPPVTTINLPIWRIKDEV